MAHPRPQTYQQFGDLREIAVTQANFCQLLFRHGKQERALSMVWDAYTTLHQHGRFAMLMTYRSC